MARKKKTTPKPKKPERKERPFTPASPPHPELKPLHEFPICGQGTQTQIDIHKLVLFDVASRDSGVYFRELVPLTKKLNDVFRREGRRHLRKMQKDMRDKSIELTIALCRGGLYLTYAKPVRRRAKRR